MLTETLLCKIYKNPENGRDAFSLSIKKHVVSANEDCQFYLDSDIIPMPIISYFDEIIDDKYVFYEGLLEYSYLNDLLDTVSEFIIMDKRNVCFYYPLDFLDKDFSLDINRISQFILAKKDVRNSIHQFLDETRLYHLLYVNHLFRIPKPTRNRSFYTKKRISRQVFESHLINQIMGEVYVEIYHRAITFKVLKDRYNKELLACCLSEYNRVILAINISI